MSHRKVTIEYLMKKYTLTRNQATLTIDICNGLNNKEIAAKNFICLSAVQDTNRRIYKILGIVGPQRKRSAILLKVYREAAES